MIPNIKSDAVKIAGTIGVDFPGAFVEEVNNSIGILVNANITYRGQIKFNKIELETRVGLLKVIDFKLLDDHPGARPVYNGRVQFWISLQKDVAKSKMNIENIIKGSTLLILTVNPNKPEKIELRNTDICDYSSLGNFTE